MAKVTKCTGAEFKAFYDDNAVWVHDGEELWVEGFVIAVNGEETEEMPEDMADSDEVAILGGFVMSANGNVDLDMSVVFRNWRKKQTTAFLNVQVPKDKLEAVKAAIVAAGGKVSAGMIS